MKAARHSLAGLLGAVQRKERPLALIASLPANDPALAIAALDGGADAIKVHVNIHHRASQTHFGSLAEERAALEQILEVAEGVPCGIVPGSDPTEIDPRELGELAAMGFDFVSLYLRDAPVGVLPVPAQLEHMLALSSDDPAEIAGGLDDLEIQVVELSILAKETYGQPLTYRDLAQYALLRKQTRLPMVVPTQHYFTEAALSRLAGIGVEAVMLGTIVAGKSPATWRDTFMRFRTEANRLFTG